MADKVTVFVELDKAKGTVLAMHHFSCRQFFAACLRLHALFISRLWVFSRIMSWTDRLKSCSLLAHVETPSCWVRVGTSLRTHYNIL